MSPKIDLPQTLRWEDGELYLLDQTLLPGKVVEERQENVEQVWDSIKKLKVRGAPAIGIAGAYGLVVAMKAHQGLEPKAFLAELQKFLEGQLVVVCRFYALKDFINNAISVCSSKAVQHLF